MQKSKFPKVLLGCPINIVKDYCMDQWLDMVKNLTYPNYDVYLVDNSRNKEYHKKLREKHCLNIDYVNPGTGKEARYYMAESIEKIRKRAVSKNYEYLFILEIDIFPPPQIIELLMIHDKPVVGTTYWTGQGHNTFLQLLYLRHLGEGKHISVTFEWPQIRGFFDGKINRAFANGNGCILIKKEVVRQINFRVSPDDIGHADSFFHQDLFIKGIDNWIDTSIMPVHWNSDWSTMPDDADHADMQNRAEIKRKSLLNQ
jgi:hypothetical protein